MEDSAFVISQDQARTFARAIYADIMRYIELHPAEQERSSKEKEEKESEKESTTKNARGQKALSEKAAE